MGLSMIVSESEAETEFAAVISSSLVTDAIFEEYEVGTVDA